MRNRLIKRFLLLLFILLTLIQWNHLFAQQKKRCGTVEYMARLKTEDPTLAVSIEKTESIVQHIAIENQRSENVSSIITIPVVFHIMYQNGTQNISENRITDQLATLNKDFGRFNADTNNTPLSFRSISANTNIRFCFAQRDPNGDTTNGIVRVPVTVTGFDPLSNNKLKYTAQGGNDAWPRDQYLNIWVCNFSGSSSQILGVSQLPGAAAATDGCCVLYTTVGGTTYPGTEPGYHLGRTLTHEAGHWLGLYHVWGDDGGGCSGTDYVADTPNQGGENYFCPAFPRTDNCSVSSPGVLFMNYLDYVDDNCMNMFTTGQSNRMNGFLNGVRSPIVNSNGCMAPIGIEELKRSLNYFSVFPNPASRVITVAFILNKKSDVMISVRDLPGQIIFSKELKDVSSVHLPIDLFDAAPGMYQVSLKTMDAVANKKIILTR